MYSQKEKEDWVNMTSKPLLLYVFRGQEMLPSQQPVSFGKQQMHAKVPDRQIDKLINDI